MSVAWPVIAPFSWLVAMISAVPAVSVVTAPEVASTVATVSLLELHATGRSVRMLLAASRLTALAAVEVPARTVDALSVTVTDATGARTVSVACPVIAPFSWLVAMISVVPAVNVVTAPEVASTVATVSLLELHVTGRSVRMLLAASRLTALAAVEVPARTVDALNVTVTDATGARTVSVACPVIAPFSWLVAMISVVPAVNVVTAPEVASTVATVSLLELHATGRSVRMLLAASRLTALAAVEVPARTVDALNVTVTDATGARTVSVACPVIAPFSWLVAMISVVPAVNVVTAPEVASTVATVSLLELHATGRSVRMLLAASRLTALAAVEVPARTVDALNVTVTDATGARTVSVACPVIAPFSWLVAMISVVPAVNVVTAPEVASTVATVSLLELHATGRSVRMLLAASRLTALAAVEVPARTVDALNVTVTDATGARTVSVACPVIAPFSWLVAMMVVVPAVSVVTTPVVGSTAATAGALELQVTGRPVSSAPPASRLTAVAVVGVPATTVEAFSVTETDATGARTVSVAWPAIVPFSWLVAMMVVVPAVSVVTTPVAGSTAAIAGALELQVTGRPVSSAPPASRLTAVAVVGVPATTVEADSASRPPMPQARGP